VQAYVFLDRFLLILGKQPTLPPSSSPSSPPSLPSPNTLLALSHHRPIAGESSTPLALALTAAGPGLCCSRLRNQKSLLPSEQDRVAGCPPLMYRTVRIR